MNFDLRNETARGWMLITIFYGHLLAAQAGMMGSPANAPVTFVTLKLLAPHTDTFFFLSGMLAPAIGKKTFKAVLPQSLMLIFCAWASQVIGMIIGVSLYGGYPSIARFLRETVKPIIYGTGDCTYIAWFFTVLGIARLLVWLFERNKPGFVLAWLALAALVWAASRLNLPDNLWEWRNWPFATLFMLAGMRIPRNIIIPDWAGYRSLAAAVVLTWFNAPGMLSHPCLTCHVAFIALAHLGEQGSLPVFLAESAAFFTFLLWVSQKSGPPYVGRIVLSIGRFVSYFGRNSLQLMLIEGWFITAFYPLMGRNLPRHENLAWMALFFLLGPPVHAGLFELLKTPVNRLVAWCFEAGRLAVALAYREPAPRPRISRRTS